MSTDQAPETGQLLMSFFFLFTRFTQMDSQSFPGLQASEAEERMGSQEALVAVHTAGN